MDEPNLKARPRTPISPPGELRGRATALGRVGIACALLGLLAFLGYGTFAARGIKAVSARDMVAAHRMTFFAGASSLAQLLLGLLAVGLGWGVSARDWGTADAKKVGACAL